MSAVDELKKLAEAGKSDAYYYLGDMYLRGYGYGVSKNFSEACNYFEEAAKKGNEKALQKLIELAQNGSEKALQKLEAFAQDRSDIQLALGEIYARKVNFYKACEWYEKSARQGNMYALQKLEELSKTNRSDIQLALGEIYASKKYFDKACDWYEKSARQGNEEAVQKLAELAKNDKENALQSLEELAKTNRSDIQLALGEIYASKKYFDKACDWYEKSARQENEDALQKLVELANSSNIALQSLEKLPQSKRSDIQLALGAVQVHQIIANKNMEEERAKAKMGDEHAQYLLLLYNLDKCLENFDNMYYKMVISFYDKLKSHINLTHLDALIKVCEQKKIEYDRQSRYGVPTYRSNTTYTPYIDTGESSEAHAFRDFGKFGSYPLYDSDEEIETDEFDF